MSVSLHECQQCGQTYWPSGDARGETLCPRCQAGGGIGEVAESQVVESPAPRGRFVALSALPAGQRLPSRRTGQPAAQASQVAPTGERIRNIAPRPSPSERTVTTPVAVPMTTPVKIPQVPAASVIPPPRQAAPSQEERHLPARQLGFNCPSCFTVLIIKDPQNYDGRAAPCPYCSVVIIPPRVAPASPFTLIAAPAPGIPALPAPAASHTPDDASRKRWRPFDKKGHPGRESSSDS